VDSLCEHILSALSGRQVLASPT